MDNISLSPKSYSTEDLNKHAKNVAEHTNLSKAQAVILVSELKNALAPIVINVTLIMASHPNLDSETTKDIINSCIRIASVLDALVS
jgi:hypothetical protein